MDYVVGESSSLPKSMEISMSDIPAGGPFPHFPHFHILLFGPYWPLVSGKLGIHYIGILYSVVMSKHLHVSTHSMTVWELGCTKAIVSRSKALNIPVTAVLGGHLRWFSKGILRLYPHNQVVT